MGRARNRKRSRTQRIRACQRQAPFLWVRLRLRFRVPSLPLDPAATMNLPRWHSLTRRRAMATATATLGKMLIDGKWCESESGGTLAVTNPATEDTVAEVAYGTRSDCARAVAAAAKA